VETARGANQKAIFLCTSSVLRKTCLLGSIRFFFFDISNNNNIIIIIIATMTGCQMLYRDTIQVQYASTKGMLWREGDDESNGSTPLLSRQLSNAVS
jgi:hypothetical protein